MLGPKGWNEYSRRVSVRQSLRSRLPTRQCRQCAWPTNVEWGELVARLESKLAALVQIVKDADPRSVVPLTDPKAVFLVHGRHDQWNTTVGSFLESLGLSVIVLEEQPNLGATLIEKFEANAEVGTAMVLLTADDVGCFKGELDSVGLAPRARRRPGSVRPRWLRRSAGGRPAHW